MKKTIAEQISTRNISVRRLPRENFVARVYAAQDNWQDIRYIISPSVGCEMYTATDVYSNSCQYYVFDDKWILDMPIEWDI